MKNIHPFQGWFIFSNTFYTVGIFIISKLFRCICLNERKKWQLLEKQSTEKFPNLFSIYWGIWSWIPIFLSLDISWFGNGRGFIFYVTISFFYSKLFARIKKEALPFQTKITLLTFQKILTIQTLCKNCLIHLSKYVWYFGIFRFATM